jgi:hypothetical protein
MLPVGVPLGFPINVGTEFVPTGFNSRLACYSNRSYVGDQHYYKQAEIRTLSLRTFFKFVCSAGWGVKKQYIPLKRNAYLTMLTHKLIQYKIPGQEQGPQTRALRASARALHGGIVLPTQAPELIARRRRGKRGRLHSIFIHSQSQASFGHW